MDENFYRNWLQGLSEGLDELEPASRSCLLKPCAKKCADTGVLKMYQQLYEQVNGNRDEFYRRMSELVGVRGEVIVPNQEYDIIFPECLCDLHHTGGINTPSLCECSRQSIIYVGEKIWGTSNFQVNCMGTVLSGEKECRFRIVFK